MSSYKNPNLPALLVNRQVYPDIRKFDQDLLNTLNEISRNLDSILNRGISFDDNVDARRVTVTSHGSPGTEFSVSHELGKVPIGRIIYSQSGAGSLYDSGTNDATTMYFKSDAASVTFKIIVF
jgi:hypothetical protein